MDSNHPDIQLKNNAVVNTESKNTVAVKEPENKTEAQKAELNKALMTAIKSPLTLVLAIAMTIITLCCFISVLTSNNIFSSGLNLWIGIVALIDCIGIWKLWGFDKEITPKSIQSFKGYLSLQRTLNILSAILVGLLSAVLLIISISLTVAVDTLSVSLSELIANVGSYLGLEILIDPDTIMSVLIIGPALLFIAALLIVIFVILYYSFINLALNKVIKYVRRLSNGIAGAATDDVDDDYDMKKNPPFISLIIFGGLYVISSVVNVGILSILNCFAIGVYFIFIALLFRKIHNQINASAYNQIDVSVEDQIDAPADNQTTATVDVHTTTTVNVQTPAAADVQTTATVDVQIPVTDVQTPVTTDAQTTATADVQVDAPADKQTDVPVIKQTDAPADKQTEAPAVKKITVQIIKKPIRTKLSIRKSRLVGNAMHKFIAVCDLENLDKNKGKAELIRLVDEGKLSQEDVTYISVDWINSFRKSGVFKDMLEAKRAEEKQLAKILEKISQKNALVKLGLPECIKDVNLSDLFNEIHARKVLADLRKNRRVLLAYKLNKQRRRYDLPKEILTPEAIEMIYNSDLFKDIREAKRLYQEHMILIPKTVSGKKSCSLLIPDCIIEEWPNRITVVDFKTGKQSKKKFVKMYTRQLSGYKNAIKHEFCKAPKATNVYSFHLDETIKIRIPD